MTGLFATLKFLRAFRHDLFQQETFGTVRALRFTLVGDHQQSIAFWARLGKRFLPSGEITIRIIGAPIKRASFARAAFHHVTAIFRTGNTDLLQPRLGISTGWEIAAGNEFPKTPITDY